MPHALWELQGFQRAIKADDDPKKVKKLEIAQPGSMSAEEYDNTVRDLVNFLSYVGEPIQVERKQLGLWVLIFLGVFTVFAYMLKKEYWKDIH